MLTETQFKVLMILFDDKGHAGWELAETLDMEESNLNPLLKKLERINFIFQGSPRKSTKPLRSKEHKISENASNSRKKRYGDYKEFPFYLNKDLSILESLIKDMIVTNKSYDIGFPFRIIRASNYFRSMNYLFKEDFNKCMANLTRELNIGPVDYKAFIVPEQGNRMTIEELLKLLHLEIFERCALPIDEKPISEEMLGELEIWWFIYNMRSCLSEDTVVIIDNEKFLNTLKEFNTYGGDINEAIFKALKKIGCHFIDFSNQNI